MKIKSFLAKPFASYIYNRIQKNMASAISDQDAILKELLKTGSKTAFGREHKLQDVKTYEDYKQAVPLRDYEQYKKYIEQIKEGKHNILWKGKPIYFAKTSGTTSGVKYIPITKESIPNHINTARNALLCYMAESGNTGLSHSQLSPLQPIAFLRNQLHRRLGNEAGQDRWRNNWSEHDAHQRHSSLDADVFWQADAGKRKKNKGIVSCLICISAWRREFWTLQGKADGERR